MTTASDRARRAGRRAAAVLLATLAALAAIAQPPVAIAAAATATATAGPGAAAPGASGPAAFELPDVMKLLARHTSGEARFTESRYVHGLDQPLVSSGTLSFVAPDRFERRTLAPRAESMLVDGNRVTLSRGGRSRTLALDATPEAQVAVEAVRGALTGNASVLQKWFRVRVAGDAAAWTLDLVPIDRGTAGALLAVRLSGRRDLLQSVETTLAGGDHAVMSIEPAAPGTGAASAP